MRTFTILPSQNPELSNFYLYLRNLYVTKGNAAFRRALMAEHNNTYRAMCALYPECRAMQPRKQVQKFTPVMLTEDEIRNGMRLDSKGNRVLA